MEHGRVTRAKSQFLDETQSNIEFNRKEKGVIWNGSVDDLEKFLTYNISEMNGDDSILTVNKNAKRTMFKYSMAMATKSVCRKEALRKQNISAQDRERIKELLNKENATGAREREDTGPAKQHVKPLRWEQSKLKNFKAILDAIYQAQMKKGQKRTAAKVARVSGQNVYNRPLPENCPSWAG
ncbi:hypothetical protein ACROYT_G014973 [Oculina patagonica]